MGHPTKSRLTMVTLGVADVAKSRSFYDASGYTGYIADPEGLLWEVAHNPFMPLDDNGRLVLPTQPS